MATMTTIPQRAISPPKLPGRLPHFTSYPIYRRKLLQPQRKEPLTSDQVESMRWGMNIQIEEVTLQSQINLSNWKRAVLEIKEMNLALDENRFEREGGEITWDRETYADSETDSIEEEQEESLGEESKDKDSFIDEISVQQQCMPDINRRSKSGEEARAEGRDCTSQANVLKDLRNLVTALEAIEDAEVIERDNREANASACANEIYQSARPEIQDQILIASVNDLRRWMPINHWTPEEMKKWQNTMIRQISKRAATREKAAHLKTPTFEDYLDRPLPKIFVDAAEQRQVAEADMAEYGKLMQPQAQRTVPNPVTYISQLQDAGFLPQIESVDVEKHTNRSITTQNFANRKQLLGDGFILKTDKVLGAFDAANIAQIGKGIADLIRVQVLGPKTKALPPQVEDISFGPIPAPRGVSPYQFVGSGQSTDTAKLLSPPKRIDTPRPFLKMLPESPSHRLFNSVVVDDSQLTGQTLEASCKLVGSGSDHIVHQQVDKAAPTSTPTTLEDQWLGLTMLVTLNDPPGVQLQGIVSSYEECKSLTLRDVVWPVNCKSIDVYTINAVDIDMVEVLDENPLAPTAVQTHSLPKPLQSPETFEHPAVRPLTPPGLDEVFQEVGSSQPKKASKQTQLPKRKISPKIRQAIQTLQAPVTGHLPKQAPAPLSGRALQSMQAFHAAVISHTAQAAELVQTPPPIPAALHVQTTQSKSTLPLKEAPQVLQTPNIGVSDGTVPSKQGRSRSYVMTKYPLTLKHQSGSAFDGVYPCGGLLLDHGNDFTLRSDEQDAAEIEEDVKDYRQALEAHLVVLAEDVQQQIDSGKFGEKTDWAAASWKQEVMYLREELELRLEEYKEMCRTTVLWQKGHTNLQGLGEAAQKHLAFLKCDEAEKIRRAGVSKIRREAIWAEHQVATQASTANVSGPPLGAEELIQYDEYERNMTEGYNAELAAGVEPAVAARKAANKQAKKQAAVHDGVEDQIRKAQEAREKRAAELAKIKEEREVERKAAEAGGESKGKKMQGKKKGKSGGKRRK